MTWFLLTVFGLLATVWAAEILLGWPLAIPLAVSLLLLAIVGLAFAVRVLRNRRRTAELEAQLRRKGSTPDVQGVHADSLLEQQTRLRELATALRRSQGASVWSSSALYAVPWYLLLGPAGAGKSTVLHTSGLTLRAAGGRAPPTQLATKGCEPWLCDRGVLIDTPGRYAAQNGDDTEWLGLLAALRRTRRRRPLDGIVLVYSLAELLGDRPEQLEDKAKRLRMRLEDLGAELGNVLPVYLLLAKADSVPGFSEFCTQLPDGASDQVWGATLSPLPDTGPDIVTAFKDEFDALKATLHAHLLEQLPSQQRPPEACAQLLRFPGEFEAVRAPLARLVEHLFGPGRQREAPVLRGFYFSSSTDSRAGAALGLKAPETRFVAHTRLSPVASRSVFLAELFPRIIFADRHFATRSRRGLLVDHRKRWLLGAAALAFATLGALPALLGCANNFSLIDDTLADTRHAQQRASAVGLSGSSREALDLLVARLGKLQAEAEQFSIDHWWGPYAAPALRDAVRVRYLEQLRATVQGPLRAGLTESIRAASDVHGLDPVGFEATLRDLKLYLMLAHPDRLEPEFATSALANVWVRVGGREAVPSTVAVATHVRSYLEALQRDPSWAWPEDGVLVTRARAQLAAMPIEEIEYAALEQAATGAPAVLPEHIFVGEAARYVSTRGKVEVPGLYTALGWQKVQPLLKRDPSAELSPWILGEQFRGAAPWSKEQLGKLYFDRYVRAWMDFLVGLDVATPTDLKSAIEEMAALDKGEGPYVRLFRRLAENVRLELDPPGLEEQARAKVSQAITQVAAGGQAPPPERRVSPVEQHFRRMLRFGFGDTAPAPGIELPPSLLSQYLDQLRALEVSLRQLQDSGIEPGTELGAELDRTSASIERLLAGFDQTERLALEPVLLNPIRGSQRVVAAKGRAALTDRWRVEVWEPYRQLVHRYPFEPKASSDVPLPDFAEFFRPQTGTLWRFYDELLSNRFLRSGERFLPRPSEIKSGFRSDFLECLAVAQQIGEAVFVDGAQQPLVPFKVKMQSVDARVSEITFNLDGETLTYRNEPEKWRALQWPGKNGPAGASLLVKGADFSALVERDEGEFGFLRLLAAGDIKPVSPGSLTLEASWRFSLHGSESQVTIQFQASRRQYPFLPGFFSRLNCPSAITSSPEPR
jgi:type VI secretion system protein ImpL